jgi:hypothetical protein
MFLELKGRIKLSYISRVFGSYSSQELTSLRGMRGGPAAISADLVPGCILRLALASMMLCSIVSSCIEELPKDGDLGPI